MRSYRMQQTYRMFCVVGVLCVVMCGGSSCGWKDAQEVIATAERMDKTEHVVYDDTAAIAGVIRKLDNPLGKLIHKNTLGKAYYYMGRSLEDNYQQVAEAAKCYIEADRLQIDNPIYRGRVNSCMGYICAQNDYDSLSLIFYERATNYFKESKNNWYYAQSLLNVTIRHIKLSSFSKADSLLKEVYSHQFDNRYLARVYETKGLYFDKQLQSDSALMYFKKALSKYRTQDDKCFIYLKIVQNLLDKNELVGALPYAQHIIQHAQDPRLIVNAYYCLILDAEATHNTELLTQYTHARADAYRLRQENINKYNEGIVLLEKYLSDPHPWSWGWILLVTIAFVCLLAVIGVVVFRKRSLNAHKQIDDLSNRLEEQEAVQSEQQRQYDAYMYLADIRAKFPKPRKQWNDYNRLKKDLNAPLQKLLCALDNSELGNKEKVFCVLYLVYSHCSLIELADYINYSEKGIRNYKQRIAQKLHISSAELYDFLQNQLRS